MERCAKCAAPLWDREGRLLEDSLCCNDCYLKAVSPQVMPMHQNDSIEFLRRLKGSPPARRQKYD